ncbi:MAG: pyridoxal-phosphate dependent enzyme, partial [Candidatus Eremiobacteraeota bacterium]|nr:pyridoxal-phosphate dependent enzyme [Candidatus Eremiobacteraeota bacterium]
SQMTDAERRRGVVAFSSGNHAQGVALAGKLLDIPTVIVMPHDAPAAKLEATRGYGAELVLYRRSEEDRGAIARELCETRGATLVPPYDDPGIVAGAGTAALELVEDAGRLDAIVVPVGGGGLFSGTCLAAKGTDARIECYGVEPEAGNDVQQSLQQGRIVTIDVPQTIADGQQTQCPSALTFGIMQRYATGVVTVSDDELRAAMRFAFERLKIVLEPSGASALAAVLCGKLDVSGKRVGVVLSGGNADPAVFASAVIP